MKTTSLSTKLLIIAVIGGACYFASLLVYATLSERQARSDEARREIAEKWGEPQTIAGPILLMGTASVLPETLTYEAVVEPEVRSRGIYDAVVYTARIKGSGTFSTRDLLDATAKTGANPTFSIQVPDTRGIEKHIDITWNGKKYDLNPGSGMSVISASGFHTPVPFISTPTQTFSFEFAIRGSENISFAPVGKETKLAVSSTWQTPKFIGSFLPIRSDVSSSGFKAEWNISSFGRPYPQIWREGETEMHMQSVLNSVAGVELYDQIDMYGSISRSIKYAILFIVVTFSAFFVFETLTKLRIHPIQYILIGVSLALFYLLLLSFAEHIGFLAAYGISTLLIAGLIAIYSARVLQNKRRASIVFAMLLLLYGYLYYVLMLEDFALLFGSLLLFVLLAAIMYLTRNVNWFETQ